MIKKTTINSLGTIITGNTPPRNHPELYGDYTPFLKATDITEGEKYTYSPEEYYSKEGFQKYHRSLIPKGSTCVVTIGSIGKKMTMAHCDCFINQAMNAIVPNESFDQEFVWYAVKNVLSNIKSLDSGTASGRENVSKSSFSKMEVIINDDKDTQIRIARVLKNYDDLIENYQKQIKLLEEAAQRIYKEWFVDFHFPGHENVKIVNGVPEGWEQRSINSFVSLYSGFAFKSKDFDENGKYKIVTIKNVKNGQFDGDNVSRIIEKPSRMPVHSILKNGDILLSLTGNVGRVCLVTGSDYLLNQRVAKLDSEFKAFVYCLFRSKNLYTIMNNLANGAAQQNLSPIKIGQVKVLLPFNDMLGVFEQFMRPLINEILNTSSQVRLLIEARDRLLPKLMSGEIEV